MNTPNDPHPGWRFAHERLAPVLAATAARLKDAPLRSGCAGPALSDAEYAAFVSRQIVMIEQLARRLVAVAMDISEAANQFQDSAAAADNLATHCDEMGRCLQACADWGDAIWGTTPPIIHTGSFAELREIPGAILTQLQPYVAFIAGAARGQAGRVVVEINIQPLIDRAARLGNTELPQDGSLFKAGKGVYTVLVAVCVLMALYSCGNG